MSLATFTVSRPPQRQLGSNTTAICSVRNYNLKLITLLLQIQIMPCYVDILGVCLFDVSPGV